MMRCAKCKFGMANSANPDQQSDLGLHSLIWPIPPIRVSSSLSLRFAHGPNIQCKFGNSLLSVQ